MDKEKCRKKSACLIKRALVLIIINEKYKSFEQNYHTDDDREKIKTFCENAQFTINETDNITADEMDDLLKNIAETDFSPYDAFICFIVGYCDSQGVVGVDGNSLSVREIIRPIIKCSSLAGKPKIFFIHNCKENRKDAGPRITTPVEPDILIVLSGVEKHEFSVNHGSWYITALAHVLKENAHCMNLTDMLAVVNSMVASMQHCDKKQTPIFMSTLRQAVRFKNFRNKPEEIPRKKPRKLSGKTHQNQHRRTRRGAAAPPV